MSLLRSVHISCVLLGYTKIIVTILGSPLRACTSVSTYVDVVVNLINLLTYVVVVVVVIIGGASTRNEPRGSVS
jgi:hypothetical protein